MTYARTAKGLRETQIRGTQLSFLTGAFTNIIFEREELDCPFG